MPEVDQDFGQAAMDRMHAAYRDRHAFAKAAKANGRRVVGYLSNTVPVEVILAAGMVPVRVSGFPNDRVDLADRTMERFFPGRVRSIYDQVLRGALNFLDLLVIPRCEEAFLQLYYFLLEARRREPRRAMPEIYLFDLLQTPGKLTEEYDHDRVQAFRERIEKLGGHPIGDEAIGDAIGAVDRSRRLLARLNELRVEEPPRLSGLDMLRVVGAVEFLDRDDHSADVRELVSSELPPLSSGPRLAIKGTPVDWDGLHQVVEECGAHIVFDDHSWGDRLFEMRVPVNDAPIAALACAYRDRAISVRSYPQKALDAEFVAKVKRLRLDGVIFFLEEWDDTLGWDYPNQKRMLDDLGCRPSCWRPVLF